MIFSLNIARYKFVLMHGLIDQQLLHVILLMVAV